MDTNLRDAITIGLPTASILLTFLFEDRRFEKPQEKRFEQVDRALAIIQADLRQFYHMTGELKGRVDTLDKRD